MKIKTSELIPPALDWAVWTAAGGASAYPRTASGKAFLKLWKGNSAKYIHPSTDWSQGGPIIDKLMLESGLVLRSWVEEKRCEASLDFPHKFSYGPTPLIAAMRCYVASKLGDEVEVPDELS